jgi:hypothetical protein
MRRRNKSQRGLTLMEVTVTLLITSVVLIVVLELVDDAWRVAGFVEANNDLAVYGQRTVNTIHKEVIQSRRCFLPTETQYISAFGPYANAAGSTLPTIQSTATTFTPDTGPTADTLYLARALEPLTVTYDHDGVSGTPKVEFVADRLQFQYYFVQTRTRPMPGGGTRSFRTLTRRVSGAYADWFQLSGITDAAQRGRLHTELIARGITRAWDPNGAYASAFYTLATNGNLTLIANPTIAGTNQDLITELGGGRISALMIYNLSNFNVQVIGPTGRRQVYARVTLSSTHAAGGLRNRTVPSSIIAAARF